MLICCLLYTSRSADLVLHSRPHDACSNLILEAMSVNIPIVGLESGSTAELLGLSLIHILYNTKFGVSIFVLKETENISDEIKDKVNKIININEINEEEFSKELNEAADKYEEEMLPPFFDVLSKYSRRGNLQFSCPGHQGGQYFMKHPAGRAMYEYLSLIHI